MAGYRMSIATDCLSGTLEDKLAAAAAARFHGVELAGSDLVTTSWSPGRIRDECARRGLTVDAYQPFPDVEAVPPAVFAANLRRAERTFAVLEEIGVKTTAGICNSLEIVCAYHATDPHRSTVLGIQSSQPMAVRIRRNWVSSIESAGSHSSIGSRVHHPLSPEGLKWYR